MTVPRTESLIWNAVTGETVAIGFVVTDDEASVDNPDDLAYKVVDQHDKEILRITMGERHRYMMLSATYYRDHPGELDKLPRVSADI